MVDLVGNRTLPDLLSERASRYPEQVCMICEDANEVVTTETYRSFVQQIAAVAGGLSRIGIRPGDAVLIILPNSAEFVVSFFALVWMGAVAVSANPASTLPELTHMATHSEAVAVIADAERAETVRALRADVPALATHLSTGTGEPEAHAFEVLGGGPSIPAHPAAGEDVVQMLFTSGSTALPKAVLLTHANMLWAGERSVRNIGLQDSDRYLTALPFFHVNAQLLTVMPSLTAGATFILLERFRASTYMEKLRTHRATVTSLVATQARTLLAQPPSGLDTDHTVRRTFYAINMSDADKDRFEQRFGLELINGYGLTEACTNVTASPLYGDRRWPSVGLPSIGREIRIVDDGGTEVTAGTPGEIQVHGIPGRTLMKGYYRNPEATAKALQDGWLHTGDTGYLDTHGYLYFVDRNKDLIKRAGENISATEVETVLLSHPEIDEAAVIGVPDPIRDEAVKAFVVLAAGSALNIEAVIAHARHLLAPFKVPTIVEIRAQLPKTSIGKIEKKQLRSEPLTLGGRTQ